MELHSTQTHAAEIGKTIKSLDLYGITQYPNPGSPRPFRLWSLDLYGITQYPNQYHSLK